VHGVCEFSTEAYSRGVHRVCEYSVLYRSLQAVAGCMESSYRHEGTVHSDTHTCDRAEDASGEPSNKARKAPMTRGMGRGAVG